jgi:hypothetical protein
MPLPGAFRPARLIVRKADYSSTEPPPLKTVAMFGSVGVLAREGW